MSVAGLGQRQIATPAENPEAIAPQQARAKDSGGAAQVEAEKQSQDSAACRDWDRNQKEGPTGFLGPNNKVCQLLSVW